jgi:hypothetical protein
MDHALLRERLTGCYVTVPTMFRDDADLSVDLAMPPDDTSGS